MVTLTSVRPATRFGVFSYRMILFVVFKKSLSELNNSLRYGRLRIRARSLVLLFLLSFFFLFSSLVLGKMSHL